MPSKRSSDPLDAAAALRFLKGLKRNNDRAWFHAHREQWEPLRHAWEDLVTMLVLEGARHDERLRAADPRRCLFRLANDTRFHKDRLPYKTHLSAWMSPGGKSGAFAGYYVQIAPGRVHFSAGIYVPERPALRALRSAFAADGADAREFDRIVRARALQPYLPLETDPLRTTPPGFNRAHPRIALIRARNYLVSRDFTERELLARGAFAIFRDAMRDAAPFVGWIDRRANAATADVTAAPNRRQEPTDDELFA